MIIFGKRNALFLFVICIYAATHFATTTVTIPIKKKGAGPLFRFQQARKWGFMDRRGKTIIKPQFDQAGDYFTGLARVSRDRMWGYIDESGHLSIPYQFDDSGDFVEGLAPVQVGRKWGIIDPAGKFVLEPRFQAIREFSDGMAIVEVWDSVKCGNSTYTSEEAPIDYSNPHEVINSIGSGCSVQNRRVGFVDRTGNLVIPPQFVIAYPFSDGFAVVSQSYDSKCGYIDKTGRFAIAPQFDQAWPFSEGFAGVEIGVRFEGGVKVAGKWGFIDTTGQFVIAPRFESVGPFSEGLAEAAEELGYWGYINKHGKFEIAQRYQETHEFSDGVAWVYTYEADRGYYIDKSGKKVLIPSREARWSFSDGLTIVGDSGDQQYIDLKGRVIASYERP